MLFCYIITCSFDLVAKSSIYFRIICKTHVCQRVENKSHKSLGSCHVSEISWGPVVQDMKIDFFNGHISASDTVYYEKKRHSA